MSLQLLKDDVAVITGASSAVGRAIARALAEQGARVALLARDLDGLEAATRELRERAFDSMALPLDRASSNALYEAADRIMAAWGKIDLWVNNSIVSVFAPVTKRSSNQSPRVIRVNYIDHVHGTLAALRHMRPQNRGVILQVGSALTYRSVPLHRASRASKAAIRSFTHSLRRELVREGSGITVTMLHLPAVNTPQPEGLQSRSPHDPGPAPALYQPDVIAQAAVYTALHSKRPPWIGCGTSQPAAVNAPFPRASFARSRGGLGRARRGVGPSAPNPSGLRSRWRHTRPVVFALLGLSAAALAFGPVRRWSREHARSFGRSW